MLLNVKRRAELITDFNSLIENEIQKLVQKVLSIQKESKVCFVFLFQL